MPITTFKINQIQYALLKKCKCKGKTISYGDGKGIGIKASFIKKISNRIKLLLFPFYLSASIDRQTGVVLKKIYKSLRNRNVKDMTIIIHPKETTNYSLEFLEEFLLLAINNGEKFNTTQNFITSIK